MKIQTAKRIFQLEQWSAQVKAQEHSGLNVNQWCKQNNVPIKTFYNHRKRVHEEMLETLVTGNTLQTTIATQSHPLLIPVQEKPVFAKIQKPQTKGAALTVQYGEYAVDIQNGADEELIEQVLRLMARL